MFILTEKNQAAAVRQALRQRLEDTGVTVAHPGGEVLVLEGETFRLGRGEPAACARCAGGAAAVGAVSAGGSDGGIRRTRWYPWARPASGRTSASLPGPAPWSRRSR